MIFLVIQTDYSDHSVVSEMKAFKYESDAFDYFHECEAEGDVNYGYEVLPLILEGDSR